MYLPVSTAIAPDFVSTPFFSERFASTRRGTQVVPSLASKINTMDILIRGHNVSFITYLQSIVIEHIEGYRASLCKKQQYYGYPFLFRSVEVLQELFLHYTTHFPNGGKIKWLQ